MGKLLCAAAIQCANLGRLEAELKALEAAGIDELHFDVEDGVFTPSHCGGLESIRVAKAVCGISCHAHLMTIRPERHIETFVRAGCNSVSIHVETTTHAYRVLTEIREAGASPGIALNPGTPLTKLDYLLPHVDRVLVLTIESSTMGSHLMGMAFERVRILHENMRYNEYGAYIEVEGNVTAQQAAKFSLLGARAFVLDSESIFKDDDTELGEALEAFKLDVSLREKTV